MEVFGCICLLMLVPANLVHLFFTALISLEQIKTGWGYGTNWDLAALFPWMLESLGTPVVILGLVFLCLSWKKPALKALRVWCGILTGLFFLQGLITNLFLIM